MERRRRKSWGKSWGNVSWWMQHAIKVHHEMHAGRQTKAVWATELERINIRACMSTHCPPLSMQSAAGYGIYWMLLPDPVDHVAALLYCAYKFPRATSDSIYRVWRKQSKHTQRLFQSLLLHPSMQMHRWMSIYGDWCWLQLIQFEWTGERREIALVCLGVDFVICCQSTTLIVNTTLELLTN